MQSGSEGIKSSLDGLRFHDCRHQAITELAENGEADMTILALAGHVSKRMIEYYSHVRQQAKRNALEKLCKVATPEGVTSQSHVTICSRSTTLTDTVV